MAYSKQSWVDGETVADAARLNHIEDGIEAAHNAASGGGGGTGALTPSGGDDGPAITAAIAAMPATGGIVRFTAGAFTIDTTVVIDKPVRFGAPQGTTITLNTDGFQVASDGITFEGLTFVAGASRQLLLQHPGDGTNYGRFRVYECRFDGVCLDISARGRDEGDVITNEGTAIDRDVQVVGCEIWGYPGNFTLEVAGVTDTLIDRCYIHDVGTDNEVGDAIKVQHGSKRTRITNCVIERPTRDCMDLYNASDTTVIGNTLVEPGSHGVDLKWANLDTLDEGRDIIANNRCYSPVDVGFSVNSHDVLCMGNYVEHAGTEGYGAGGSNDNNTATQRIRFIGNEANFCGEEGFNFYNGIGFLIIGNVARQCGFEGIYLSPDTQGFTLIGNRCTNNTGDDIDISSANASTHFLAGNLTDDPDYDRNFTVANATELLIFDGNGNPHPWLSMSPAGTLIVGEDTYDVAFNGAHNQFYGDSAFYGELAHEGPTAGFYGAVPVPQATDPGTASGTDAAVINNIVTVLRNLGLVQ